MAGGLGDRSLGGKNHKGKYTTKIIVYLEKHFGIL